MTQSTAHKTEQSGHETTSHVLTLPLEGGQTDRNPHNYERWLVAKLMRMAGSPPIGFSCGMGT